MAVTRSSLSHHPLIRTSSSGLLWLIGLGFNGTSVRVIILSLFLMKRFYEEEQGAESIQHLGGRGGITLCRVTRWFGHRVGPS